MPLLCNYEAREVSTLVRLILNKKKIVIFKINHDVSVGESDWKVPLEIEGARDSRVKKVENRTQ
jgi:hypothetical protein